VAAEAKQGLAADRRKPEIDAVNMQQQHDEEKPSEKQPHHYAGDSLHRRDPGTMGNAPQQHHESVHLQKDGQQLQARHQDIEDNLRHRNVMAHSNPLHPGGRESLGAGRIVKLSQHPDCIADVHKYCKRSNLHNFAVAECLQDDLAVSINNCVSTIIP